MIEGSDLRHHPTLKPVSLMRWLVRLILPKGGLCLDPFAGTGTTNVATLLEGGRALGLEREEDYCKIASARCAGFEQFEDVTAATPADHRHVKRAAKKLHEDDDQSSGVVDTRVDL